MLLEVLRMVLAKEGQARITLKLEIRRSVSSFRVVCSEIALKFLLYSPSEDMNRNLVEEKNHLTGLVVLGFLT